MRPCADLEFKQKSGYSLKCMVPKWIDCVWNDMKEKGVSES